MSFDVNWDIDKYKEDHECDEHWTIRRMFMEKWKNDFSEERLVCLARVFANMEFMGCRYPTDVMQEVARLSHEIAQNYRNSRKNKLKRTFVSASDAAEDRARGVKREGGVVIEGPTKSAKISFVPQGQEIPQDIDDEEEKPKRGDDEERKVETNTSRITDANEILKEMRGLSCLDVRLFDETMFYTEFGRMVLLIRPWGNKMWNIKTSCQSCRLDLQTNFENNCFSITINGKLLAEATGASKPEAKSIVEMMAWNRLREEVVSIVVKEQWIAHGNERISVQSVAGRGADQFGAPVENSVASKMMKLMGWKGGGLGADAQGIAEPIKPNLQMVNRAGLGSIGTDIRRLRQAATGLMRRYLASDTIDVDLVFSSDFSKEERAQLHQIAQRAGLASRSYGVEEDRFLVVKKKLDPFSLVLAVIEKGGDTPKYQVFIPKALSKNGS